MVFQPVDLAGKPEPKPLEYVVEGLVPVGETTNLFGDSGQGKSTVVCHMALCIVEGKPFLGKKTIKGEVLFLDWELNEDRTLERFYKLARGMGLSAPPRGINYREMHEPLDKINHYVKQWCEANKPALIILDSYIGASGSDPTDQEAATKLMGVLRELPFARLLIDHQSNPVQNVRYQDKRAFGSAYKTHLTRSSLQLEQVNNEPGKASAILRHNKNNFGAKLPDIYFHTHFEKLSTRLELAKPGDPKFQKSTSSLTQVERHIINNGPCTANEIVQGLSLKGLTLTKKTVQNHVSELRDLGKMPRKAAKRGRETIYEIVPKNFTT